MTIDDLISEGQKLQTSKLKSAKDNTRYHTWTNNCETDTWYLFHTIGAEKL